MNDPALTGKKRKKTATATPAPELIPIIPGSARSFRVTLCRMEPDNAKAMPASSVIRIRGNLTENNTKSSLKVPCPNRTGSSLSKDREEYPIPMLTIAVSRIKPVHTHRIIRCFRTGAEEIMRVFYLLSEQQTRRKVAQA
ncbi:hypothetical protein D3C78_991000 [compost metagenome]